LVREGRAVGGLSWRCGVRAVWVSARRSSLAIEEDEGVGASGGGALGVSAGLDKARGGSLE
jgi:hypothetical protein